MLVRWSGNRNCNAGFTCMESGPSKDKLCIYLVLEIQVSSGVPGCSGGPKVRYPRTLIDTSRLSVHYISWPNLITKLGQITTVLPGSHGRVLHLHHDRPTWALQVTETPVRWQSKGPFVGICRWRISSLREMDQLQLNCMSFSAWDGPIGISELNE